MILGKRQIVGNKGVNKMMMNQFESGENFSEAPTSIDNSVSKNNGGGEINNNTMQ